MKTIKFNHNGKTREVGYLLTINSAKTKKGEKLGVLTGILYLNNRVDNKLFCPSSTDACRAPCLIGAGKLSMISGVTATTNRALLFVHDLEQFLARLKLEISVLVNKARSMHYTPALRLNGTSDIPWEYAKYGEIIQWAKSSYPDLEIYDYTKIPGRAISDPDIYNVTFSWSGANLKQCNYFLSKGVNVAVPFDLSKKQPLPDEFLGYPVIDGDLHDLRFLDPRGVVVGLRYKHSFDGPSKGRKMIKNDTFLVTA